MMKVRTIASLFLCLSVFSVKPALSSITDREITSLHALLSAWQVVEAREKLEVLLKKSPADVNYRFAKARLLYLEGKYRESVETLDALMGDMGETTPESIKAFRARVGGTYETLKSFDEHSTADGRFLIRYKGRDKVLIPYLVEVLEATDKVLAADFDYRPKGRVLVEIYPAINYLAKVSPLSEKDIETSGTIALCKYNRLMFTSPRALVRGYGWRDTVAHEFVHYYVTKMSMNTVPIWLHEGIAKFQETRWRFKPGHAMEPPQENLLARSLKADKLITFQQMHPSMAKLPSQEAAGLAFAEVHTVIDYLYRQKDYTGLRRLLAGLRSGLDMDVSLKSVYGVDLSQLWTAWKKDLKQRGLREFPGLVQQSLEFKRPGEKEKDPDKLEINYGSIKEKRVRDFTHLGELLRARKRPKAALKEYRKAEVIGGDGNPVLQNGLAEALLSLKRYDEVPKALARVKSYYPDFVRTHLNLGRAYIKLAKKALAISEFEAVIGVNPFHPMIYIALEKLYREAGKQQLAERAKKSLELLR